MFVLFPKSESSPFPSRKTKFFEKERDQLYFWVRKEPGGLKNKVFQKGFLKLKVVPKTIDKNIVGPVPKNFIFGNKTRFVPVPKNEIFRNGKGKSPSGPKNRVFRKGREQTLVFGVDNVCVQKLCFWIRKEQEKPGTHPFLSKKIKSLKTW